jgi:hypothetical protein
MIAALLALLLFTASPGADAQGALTPGQAGATAPVPSATPAPLAAPAAAAPAPAAPAAPGKPAPTAEELLSGTVARDIDSASYYELVIWCQQLGLDDSGSRKDLQVRLARHFSVTLPDAPAPGKRSVTVRSARESEYFTQSETGDKYVLLRGDVVVQIKEMSDGSTQEIKAASLTFNQTRRTMSAVGAVTYTLTRGSQTDVFTGQSVDFNLDSSEAVFYDGSTRRTIKSAGGDVLYTFAGETITRESSDTIILKKGAFTSSETPADPLYQIRAGTVWLLAPSEWAVQDAVLLIGRVPVLYLPGFFWPGDDFFFNPNVGYKMREGSFLQTTTYLLGRKQKQDSPFSFLQLGSSGDAGYALEPHGLFLRKMPGSTPPKDDGHTLKLMVDGYSRLGAMAGLAGDFSPLGTFRTSVGVSRSIFLDYSTQLYTPYLPLANPPYNVGDEFWNSSSVFGLAVPFRYGMEGTFKTSGGFYSLTAGFQYFSDPSFTTDFYTRSESGMLSALFAQPGVTPLSTPQQVNLAWDLTGTMDFTKMVKSPYIQTLSMPSLNLRMTWQSNTPSGLSDPLASDPGHAFYYPSSITAPNVTFTMSGDLLNVGAGASAAAPQLPAATSGGAPVAPPTPPPDPGKGMREPKPAGRAPERPKEIPPRIPFRSPDALANEQVQQLVQGNTFKLSYQIQPRATLEHTFDTAGWTTAQSVNYGFLYRTFETGGTSTLTAAASFWDRLADTSLTLSADGLWRSRFNPSAAEQASPAWPNLLLLDQQQDRLAFRSVFQGTVRPFPAVAEISSSSLQYRINFRMYQIGLTGTDPYNPLMTSLGPAWSPDAISEHSFASTLALVTPATSESLAVTLQLPPLVPTMTASLDASGGALKGRVQGGFAAPPSAALQYQPLVVSGSVSLGAPGASSGGAPTATGAFFTASQELQFDVGNSLLSRSTSQLAVDGFSAAFVAQNTGSPNQLVPATVKAGYESNIDPLWFWKDRIKLVPGLKTHWYQNIQNYIDNLFDFSPSLTLTVYKSLDITFSSVSNNTRTYLYIPGWTGMPWVNPLTDLLQSVNFFNNDDRRRSGFKIQTISLKAVQHFPDWDVSVQYQGSPQLITHTNVATGAQFVQNEWSPTFSILVQWKAVSEVKSTIHQEYTGTTTVPLLR